MTTQRLRELLEERVADVEAGDLSTRAWARADGVRRRRRIAAIGTAAAAVLVVAGGVAVLDDSPPRTSSPTGRPTASPSTPTPPPSRSRKPSTPAISAARHSGGRRPPSSTPSSRCCRYPAFRTCCRWSTRTRSARHRPAWTRCSARRSSSTGCSATTGSSRSTCLTGWVRWATRAATCSTRWVIRACRPTARRSSSGSPGASRSGTCRRTPGARWRPPTTSRPRGPATASCGCRATATPAARTRGPGTTSTPRWWSDRAARPSSTGWRAPGRPPRVAGPVRQPGVPGGRRDR